MEQGGLAGAGAAAPAVEAGLLAEVKSWLFPISALFLFCVYPLLVLAWTAAEGAAASRAQEALKRCGSGRRLSQGRRGRGERQEVAEKLRGKVKCSGPEDTKGDKGAKPKGAVPQAACSGWPSARFLAQRASGCLALAATAAGSLASGGLLLACALRLALYSLMLSPWFLQIGYRYFHDPSIRRTIRYGPHVRNYVDVYLPSEAAVTAMVGEGGRSPVVVTVMGGAWIIGHRLWNVLLAMRLAQAGVTVVAVDYRNYPRAFVHEMVEDVGAAVDWTFAKIASYGGDPRNVALIGQSAGAHLEAMLLLQRSMEEARAARAGGGPAAAGGPARSWSVGDLRGWFGVAGPYDLFAIMAHLERRRLPSCMHHLFEGGDVARQSPMHVLESPEWLAVAAKAAARMPPVYLLSGGKDRTVPVACSARFAEALRAAGAGDVRLDVRPGLRHAEPVVEDPLTGGDMQVKLLLRLLIGESRSQKVLQSLTKPPYPQVPRALASLALTVMPF